MDEIKAFLSSKGIYQLPKASRLVAVVEAVAEIPWGEGRDVEEVLCLGKGTCTGKHLVLQACLAELGIESRPVVCTFRWGDQTIKYPEKLRLILREGEWEHGHNFLQVIINGNYVDIDVTWNSRLKPHGFKAFPKGWDGKTPFVGVDKIIRRWDGIDIKEKKQQLIDSLSPKSRKNREKFLNGFVSWVESLNFK
jgi:hypothetical protein